MVRRKTRGRISHAPLVPDIAGLSTDGPLARTVADAAQLLDVMTGNRPGDMYTLPPLPAGETFLGHARRVLLLVHVAQEDVSAESGQLSGRGRGRRCGLDGDEREGAAAAGEDRHARRVGDVAEGEAEVAVSHSGAVAGAVLGADFNFAGGI